MSPCPNQANHVEGPPGFFALHEWATRMERTHTQERCPHCGLWAIWTPKAKA